MDEVAKEKCLRKPTLCNSYDLHMSQKGKKYKQWQRNPNIPIPKRTLARLKKARTDAVLTSDVTFEDLSELSEDCSDLSTVSSNTERQTIKGNRMHVDTSDSDSSVCVSDRENEDDYRDQDELANSELLYLLPDDDEYVPTCSDRIEHDSVEADAEPFHLLEEEDYRDSTDQVYCPEYDSMSSVSDSEDDTQNVASNGSRKPLYSGSSISVEDSILSIMKYSIKHKTTYAAISDLLELISLHLPYGSNKEHLKSLYFLKKAFAANEDQDGIVTALLLSKLLFWTIANPRRHLSILWRNKIIKRKELFFDIGHRSATKENV